MLTFTHKTQKRALARKKAKKTARTKIPKLLMMTTRAKERTTMTKMGLTKRAARMMQKKVPARRTLVTMKTNKTVQLIVRETKKMGYLEN